MKLIVKPARSRLAAGPSHSLSLLVRLVAPAPPEGARRPPVCILPVVDVSGSMGGEKLTAVQKALQRMASHLVPGDHLGLVSFANRATTLLPICEVTATSRRKFLDLVKG